MAIEVSVAELKNRLSHYLRSVQQGEELVIKNRDAAVARLVPYANSGRPRLRTIPPTLSLKEVQKALRSLPRIKSKITRKDIAEALRWTRRDVYDKFYSNE